MTRLALNPRTFGFTLLLAAIGGLAPLAIDMGLPAFGAIARSLDTRPAITGLTLSLFMAGFAVGPLAAGPVSDRFGRRRVLLAGLALFTVGGGLAAAAPTIGWLLSARVVQGLGGGTDATLAYAIIRDLFQGREAQRRIASMSVVSMVAPMIAPSLGTLILTLAGWRAIYAFTGLMPALVLVLVWIGLAETRSAPDPSHRRRGLARQTLHDVASLSRNRDFMLCNGISALGFAALFAYVSGSPLIVIAALGVSRAHFAVLFAATSLAITAGAFANGQLATRMARPDRLLGWGTSLVLAADLVLLALTVTHAMTLPRLVPLLLVANAAFGLTAPGSAHGALEAAPRQAGVAAGLLTTTQMVCGAGGSFLVSVLFPRLGLIAVTGTMAAFALLAWAGWMALAGLGRTAPGLIPTPAPGDAR